MTAGSRTIALMSLGTNAAFAQMQVSPEVQKAALESIQQTQNRLLIGFAGICIVSLLGMIIALWRDGPPSFQGTLGGLGGAGGGWRVSPALTLMAVAIAFATLLAAIGVYGVRSVSAFVTPPADANHRHRSDPPGRRAGEEEGGAQQSAESKENSNRK